MFNGSDCTLDLVTLRLLLALISFALCIQSISTGGYEVVSLRVM